jgi:hypothetical protein
MAVLLPVLFGCDSDRGREKTLVQPAAAQEESSSSEPAAETYALGTAMTPSGAVAETSTWDNFVRGGEVFLSVDVSGASSSQNVEVRWVDPAGNVIRRDQRAAPQGAHYLPFTSGRTSQWRPGEHRAVIVIDGRRVSEKRFALL